MAITRILPGVLALLTGSGIAVAQAPVNDDCANASLAAVGLTNFDCTLATDGSGAPLIPAICDMGPGPDEQIYQDVWFLFSPAATDNYDIAAVNNGNAPYDSELAVYDQSTCPDDPALVLACDDDAGPGSEAAVFDVPLVAGNTYLIRVGSYGPGTTKRPAALSIAAAIPVIPPGNDDCANATVVAGSGPHPFDNTFASTDGSDLLGFCDPGPFGDEDIHNDVWFTYTSPVSECAYVSTFGQSGFDTRLAIYSTTTCPDDPASVIACSDDEVQPAAPPFEAGLDVDLLAGATYLIRLGSFSANSTVGNGSFSITTGPMAVLNDGGMQPGAPGCAPGPVFTDSCNGDGGDQIGCTSCPCGNDASPGTVGGCINGSFRSAMLTATGDPSVSLPAMDTTDMRFSLTGAKGNVLSVLTSGDSLAPTSMANPCFGMNSGEQSPTLDGLRCIDVNVRLHGGRMTDSAGDVGATNSPWGGEGQPAAGVANAGAGFVSGQTRQFQVLYREDPLAVCLRGLNTSQAVEVTFLP